VPVHRAVPALTLALLPALAQSPAPAVSLGAAWAAQWQLRTRGIPTPAAPPPLVTAPTATWRVATGQTELPPACDGQRLVVVQARPKKVQTLDAATGALLWEVPFTGLMETPPQLSGDLLIFGLDGGRLVVLDAGTGALRHLLRLPLPKGAGEEGAKVRQLFPLVSGDTLVAGWQISGPEAKADRALLAFDLTSGALRWSASLAGPSEVHPVLHEGRVIAGGNGQLAAFDLRTGDVAWSTRLARKLALESAQVIGGRLLLRNGQEILAFDAATGKPLWAHEAEKASLLQGTGDRLVFTAPRGVFATAEWLVALDARTGQIAWDLEAGEVRLPWVKGDRVFTSLKDDVVALDLATGRQVWRRDLGGALQVPLLLGNEALLALHRAKGGTRALTLQLSDGREAGSQTLKERWGPGTALQGSKVVLLPLAEGGLAAFP
jgi:outer membrane protein assembly factor BamB